MMKKYNGGRFGIFKNRIFSAFLGITILTTAFITALLPITEIPVYADAGKTINIVTNGSGTGISKDDHIYFGTKTDGYVYKESQDGDGTDPYWRVLDPAMDNAGGNKAMFVMAESLWGTGGTYGNVCFKQNESSNVWQGSDAQGWCTTFKSAVFSTNEQSVIKSVSKNDAEVKLYTLNWFGCSLSNEQVFFLSAQEASDYVSAINGSALNAIYNGNPGSYLWWLRSPCKGSHNEDCAGVVEDDTVESGYIKAEWAARPAFNINLEAVILTSAAEGGKNPGTGGVGTLNTVAPYTGSKWKLTILDSGRSGFTASVEAGEDSSASAIEGYTSWTVPVTYSGAKTGSNEHVSAILTDSDGKALYYGHIAANSTGGTQNVTIPTGLTKGTYKLNVFSEQANEDKKTDYSSPIRKITLTVSESGKVAAPVFSPAAGAYTGAQSVGISCATDGAEIYYTTDSTVPTVASTKYTYAISVSETTTIKAMAAKNGMTDSGVAEATYTITDEETFAVTFDANGHGKASDPTRVAKGSKVPKPSDPEAEGWKFGGWYKEASCENKWDFENDKVTSDTTLYAKWEKSGEGDEKVKTEGVIEIKISNESRKIIEASLAAYPDLQQKVNEAIEAGKDIEFVFESKDLGDSAEGAGDIRGYNESQGLELGKFFDLTLLVRTSDGDELGRISNTSDAVGLEVLIPDELYSSDRIFYILRFHEGSVTEVGSGREHSVPIKTDGFSTYAIAYKEIPEELHDDEKHEDKKRKEKDHTPPSWILNPNEKQALGITYTGLAPGTTAGYQEQGEAAKALLASVVPKGWTKAFSFNLLNGGVPDQTLKLGTLTMFIHPEWQKEGRQYAMLSLDRYGNVAFLPDIDTDPIRCTVNLNFEGYALDVLYKDS